MKRIILGLFLFAAVSTLSFGRVIIRGESNTSFGAYTIEVSDKPVIVAGEELKCYLIRYENSPLLVKVLVDKEKNCKNYVVLSDDLSIMYTCNAMYLGVNKLNKKYRNAGMVTSEEKLDRNDYFHQKVLTQGISAEFDVMGLIASFYPELIK